MDAHYPYVPGEQYDCWGGDPLANLRDSIPNAPMSKTFLEGQPWGQLRALESLYDGCIRQLDAAIKQLITGLKQSGAYDDTLIVITSDHGEGFAERSLLTPEVRLVDHSWGIGEELTHVPLLMKEPTQKSGRVIDKLATLTQFPDVISAAVAGRESVSEFLPSDGTVLSSTYRVVPPGPELPLDETDRQPYFGPWRALYRERDGDVYKFAQRRNDELTALVRDAQISYTIEDSDGGEVTQVFDRLSDAGVQLDAGTNQDVDDDVENRLEDLGYLR
jgi:arylsulfatase A-like enzyme